MDILVVDDEAPICELIGYNIRKEGWTVLEAENGTDAIAAAIAKLPGLIILDLMLSDMSGLDVCRILKGNPRTARIPIVMVTARTEDADIVAGLELGADDYITKPFSPRVLVARVRSVLRRVHQADEQNALESSRINSSSENIIGSGNKKSDDSKNVISVHNISVNINKHEVRVNGKCVEFSATEFDILLFLSQHEGQVFSRQQIINAVKGSGYPVTDRSIDVQILGIRRKIGDSAESEHPVIETLRGVGYRMTDEEDENAWSE
jgi:two-component system phosphate regulon response regulator PhoB